MTMTASAATAEVQWSHANTKWSGTLTFERDGGSAKTCTVNHSASTAGNSFWSNLLFGWTVPCGKELMSWYPLGWAESDGEGGYELLISDARAGGSSQSSPWGSSPAWYPVVETITVPFSNASGGTPSHVTFDDTYLGDTTYGEEMTATGTLNVLTSDGKSSVTLSGE
jgi:hypothetical protein